MKIIVPFRSNPTRNRKSQKNSKKIQKFKKVPLWIHFKPKFKISLRFVPTRRVIENSKKIQKIKKYRYVFFSSQNKFNKVENGRK